MDFAIGLVNSVLDLGNPKYRRAVINVHKIFGGRGQVGGGGRARGGGGGWWRMGVVEMMFWPVHASYSLSSASYRLKFS